MAKPELCTEIRVMHSCQEDKEEFETKLQKQADLLTNGNKRAYLRLVVNIDSATGIIKKLKDGAK